MIMVNQFDAEFNYMDNVFSLKILINGARFDDINALEKGVCEFGLYVEQPVIFFLFRIHEGDITSNVQLEGDASYTYHLVPPGNRTIPSVNDQQGIMGMFIIDGCEVKARRMLGLGKQFVDVFRKAITIQAQSKWNVSKYDAKINEVYDGNDSLVPLFALSPVIVLIPEKK